ncbi:Encoded by, partial [Rhizoctonia solani]
MRVLNRVPKVGIGHLVKFGRKTLAASSNIIGPRANISEFETLGTALRLSKAIEVTVKVKWIPGHSEIEGNELADKLAKSTENIPPTPVFNRTITWARASAIKRVAREWRKVWNDHTTDRPHSSTFILRNPSTKLHPIFNSDTLPRNVETRLVQFPTEHGFYGEQSMLVQRKPANSAPCLALLP